MIAFIVRFEVKPDREKEFVTLVQGLAEKVNANEPGNHLYQLCRDPEKPGHYIVLERYQDEDAFKAHTKSAHFREAGAVLAEMLAGPLSVDRLEEVG